MRFASAVVLATLAACSSSTVIGVDAGVCTRADECPADATCIEHACRPPVACTSSRMCPDLVCDTTLRRCVECLTSADCPAGLLCIGDVCAPAPTACHSDRDCSAMGLVCDGTHAVCVECNAPADCEAADYCASAHTCVADACTAGATMCRGVGLATCEGDGSGYGAPAPCPSGACSGDACVPPMDAGTPDAAPPDASHADAGTDAGLDAGSVDAGSDAATSGILYHGWAAPPLAGCSITTYDTTAPTVLGGSYPFNAADLPACRAWKLAATVCTTEPVMYSGLDNWTCPESGGFTHARFGTFCAAPGVQYACSTCPGACNATCVFRPLSLRNCSGTEVDQM